MRLIQVLIVFVLILLGLGLVFFTPFLIVEFGLQSMMPLYIPIGFFLGILIVILSFAALFRVLGSKEQRPKSLTAEEAQMLRQVWDGQDRMEERITHLETILLERHQ